MITIKYHININNTVKVTRIRDLKRKRSETKVFSSILFADLIKDAIHAMQEQGKEDVAENQLGIKKEASPVLVVPEDAQTKWNISNDIYAMMNKLDSVLEIVQDQQQELTELRVEVF